ncbi:MAG: M20/M25/M40 family metallo-hydrolase [Terriglobales bacterium]
MRLHSLALGLALAGAIGIPAASAQAPSPDLAQQILKQLIEINTTDAMGTTKAAQAMQKRLLAAGFPPADVQLVGSNPNKMNLVARLRGAGAKPPILLIGHLDVVQARRQDWSTDPFQLVTRNGVYYGRGTQDMKDGDAIFVATLIHMKQSGYKPDRDIILALTAAEEGGTDNGVRYLLASHRDLIQAAYVLNADGGGVDAVKGKPLYLGVEATEKLYADFQLSTTNPGGHSSLPRPDNAIYDLAAALENIHHYTFPVELNSVTRGFFAARARLDHGQLAADELTMSGPAPTAAAARRLSQNPDLNALLRTTCVATRLSAGDANNALPQNAEAIVNCRILPGHSAREIQQKLVSLVANPKIKLEYMSDDGVLHSEAPTVVSNPPVALSPEVMDPLRRLTAAMWPGLTVVPEMEAGATDGKYTNAAGMPTYALAGIQLDEDNIRAHGRDEDMPIAAFDKGFAFYYRYLTLLTGGK